MVGAELQDSDRVEKSSGRTPIDTAHLFKGMLLRHTFYQYCQQVFPNISDSIKIYGTWEWNSKRHGMRSGRMPKMLPESEEEGGAQIM